jgi:phosphohistidine phosphatase
MAFNLYLIRHGLAVDRREQEIDSDRPLTEEGKTKTKQVAKRLQDLGLGLNAIQTSPLVRAQQTSEIFSKVFNLEVASSDYLAPDGSFDAWLDQFGKWRQLNPQFNSLGLIGHEPDLSTWAELLLWGRSRDAIVLKKAGIIGLSLPDHGEPIGECFLFLLVPPKLLI